MVGEGGWDRYVTHVADLCERWLPDIEDESTVDPMIVEFPAVQTIPSREKKDRQKNRDPGENRESY
jgi:hypothetical protein